MNGEHPKTEAVPSNERDPLIAALYLLKGQAQSPIHCETAGRAIHEIERLTRERDEALSLNEELTQARKFDGSEHWARISGDWSRRCGEMQAERDRLIAENAELRRKARDALSGASPAPETSARRLTDSENAAMDRALMRSIRRVPDPGAVLVAELFPYLQQYECADAAELEAKALLTERTERYLAGFAPKASDEPG